MRQNSSNRRYGEYGYLPKTSVAATRSGGGGGGAGTPNPEVVVNGRGNESSDSVGSSGQRGGHSAHGLESNTSSSRLGTASNPNRAEMPDTGRRKSYDPVSESVCVCVGRREEMMVANLSFHSPHGDRLCSMMLKTTQTDQLVTLTHSQTGMSTLLSLLMYYICMYITTCTPVHVLCTVYMYAHTITCAILSLCVQLRSLCVCVHVTCGCMGYYSFRSEITFGLAHLAVCLCCVVLHL